MQSIIGKKNQSIATDPELIYMLELADRTSKYLYSIRARKMVCKREKCNRRNRKKKTNIKNLELKNPPIFWGGMKEQVRGFILIQGSTGLR